MIPDHPALGAVFKGRHTGRAVVDDVEHPMEFYDYDPHSAGLADLRQRLPADLASSNRPSTDRAVRVAIRYGILLRQRGIRATWTITASGMDSLVDGTTSAGRV